MVISFSSRQALLGSRHYSAPSPVRLPSVVAAVLAIFGAVFFSESLVAQTSPVGGSAGSSARPNLLLLLSDDHSYPFLSTYGHPHVKTPQIDALARDGFKGNRFFTTAPQCVPSRASLMTGRSPVAARITRFSSPLAQDEVTLPEMLRSEAGYFTGICGRSFHLDGSSKNPVVTHLLGKNQLRTFAQRVDFLKGSGDEKVPSLIEEFLAQKPAEKPFFLWANFTDPHHVWNAPAQFRPDPASLQLPAHWPDLPGVRSQLADYLAEVNRLDQTVGRVIETLKKAGVFENTLILFVGDNGAALPHGKGSLYDPGCHVPCVAHWSGKIKSGQESHYLLSGEDVAPTFLEAAGVKPPSRMSGRSFLPLLLGQSYVARQHVFMERGPHGDPQITVDMKSSGYDQARAVRSDRYKLIYNALPWLQYSPVDTASEAAWQEMTEAHTAGKLSPALSATYFAKQRPVYELYDLEADPSELDNLSGKKEVAEVEAQLRMALTEKMMTDFDYLPLPDSRGAAHLLPQDAASEKGNAKAGDQAGRRKQFAKLDANGDHFLSQAEFDATKPSAVTADRFNRRDLDRDGKLSLPEYLPQSLPPPVSGGDAKEADGK